MSGLVQNFEYFIFCCIVTHVVVITSESGNTYGWIKSHKTAAHALDVLILCIYRYASLQACLTQYAYLNCATLQGPVRETSVMLLRILLLTSSCMSVHFSWAVCYARLA